MNLESPQITVNKSQKVVYNFLTDIKNFQALMPENISKFEILGDDTFLFALKGMPEIVLKKKEVIPSEKITLGAAGGKIDFSLIGTIASVSDSTSKVQLEFSGDFNPMMAMMIKGPITKFIETLATNIPHAI